MPLDVAPSLAAFFNPRGIAIVGASADPAKLGFGLARNLVQSGYGGAIHFVNPRGGRLLERPLYRDLTEVPDPVDLAVVLVAAPRVPELLEACAERGIRSVIIAAGGFRETGPEGMALEERCLAVARRHGIRLMGPNCVGIIDTHLPMDTIFLPPPGPSTGGVAFISQSGAICAAVIDWARGQGFGLSRLVSMGNQLDIQETDMLAPVAADPHTRVVTLYLEGVQDGRRFVEAASAVSRVKPVVAFKVGRSESGRRAAASHTGALAGADTAISAAFRRAGVIRAETSEELFDWARALAWCPTPKGRRVAVLSNAGGPGVAAADALDSYGLKLADIGDGTRAGLKELLPEAASTRNPVDMLAGASPSDYAHCLRILLDDAAVDMVMVILPPPPMFSAGGVARAIIPTIFSSSKPVVVALMGERMIQEAVAYFRAAKVPDYRFPERAASALSILARHAEFLAGSAEAPLPAPERNVEDAEAIVNAADSGEWLAPDAVAELMRLYDISLPRSATARNAGQASTVAAEMGFPVVMKVDSPDIAHKSDVGGVALHLMTADAVNRAFTAMMASVRDARPEANLHGVTVQREISDGQDVIVGVVRDPQFGPVIMFGSGGVEVEGLKDVAVALAPLTRTEAEALLADTWAGRKLAGYRHLPAADREAVIDVMVRLGHLAADLPGIAEIEINPLRVMPAGKGVLALDVRARRGEV